MKRLIRVLWLLLAPCLGFGQGASIPPKFSSR